MRLLMFSDKTKWLQVEEVVPKLGNLIIGSRDEMKQTCKFVKIVSVDKEFSIKDILVVPVNAINKKYLIWRAGRETNYFVDKNCILLILENARDNYVSFLDLKEKNLCDEHKGIPRLEYV